MKIVLLISLVAGLAWLFVSGCSSNKKSLFGRGYRVEGEKVTYTHLEPQMVWHSKIVYRVEGADPSTFEALDTYYGKDGNSAFYRQNVIPESDGPSFSKLKKHYFSDRSRVYYYGKPISDDPDHFEFVRYGGSKEFARDRKYVYVNGKVLEGADGGTFESLDGLTYFRDGNTGYYQDRPLEGSDGKTFRSLGKRYARDHQSVWYGSSQIDEADPSSFRTLVYPYSKDGNHVYLQSKVLTDRPNTFRYLGRGRTTISAYATDGIRIFAGRKVIEGADIATFNVLERGYSRDAYYVYYVAKPMTGMDPATIEVLNAYYVKDANAVYFEGKPIEGADPATFEVHARNKKPTLGRDKNHIYRNGKVSKGKF